MCVCLGEANQCFVIWFANTTIIGCFWDGVNVIWMGLSQLVICCGTRDPFEYKYMIDILYACLLYTRVWNTWNQHLESRYQTMMCHFKSLLPDTHFAVLEELLGGSKSCVRDRGTLDLRSTLEPSINSRVLIQGSKKTTWSELAMFKLNCFGFFFYCSTFREQDVQYFLLGLNILNDILDLILIVPLLAVFRWEYGLFVRITNIKKETPIATWHWTHICTFNPSSVVHRPPQLELLENVSFSHGCW